MSESSSQDKTEKASPQKIKKAREQGQIPRAKELTTAIIFILVLVYFYNQLPIFWQGILDVMQRSMTITREELNNPLHMIGHLGDCLVILIELMLPLFGLLAITTLMSTLLVGGWLFYPGNVFPKLSKISPITGIKRIFSSRSVVELVKSTLKVTVIFGLLFLYLEQQLVTLLNLQHLPLKQGVVAIMHTLFFGLLWLSVALLIFGLLDVPYQLWEHQKQLRMTKQEVKEEYKTSEGRPEVKQRIRQIQQQFARRRIDKAVPQADVIIVNPTHYAVAIKYDPTMSDAPFVIAKGVDETAMHIQRIARAHNVEVVHSPPLTRSIYYTTAIEQAIPSQLYVAVAHILTYVLQVKAFRDGRGGQPMSLPHFSIPKHLQH